jgi:hypothetical protein
VAIQDKSISSRPTNVTLFVRHWDFSATRKIESADVAFEH